MAAAGSWIEGAPGSGFDADNLPYGVFVTGAAAPRVGVRIGGHVIDLAPLLDDALPDVATALAAPSLNAFMAFGRAAWRETRAILVDLVTDERHRPRVTRHLVPLAEVSLQLPFEVADYVDFYSSEHHATNVGTIFRPDGDPLTPNWKHLPIGYHGRAGTVVVSGTDVVRPCGQRVRAGDERPTYGPSLRLDIEAEVGFVVGVPSTLGGPVPIERFEEHVFGVCLVNDWSARDIQAWEAQPLGPFLGKSFCTSVAGWVVPLEALDAARVAPPPRDPQPLPYLRDDGPTGLDLRLEVDWNGTVVSRPPFAGMYWTAPQQLVHMTSNGASLRTGDLYASGTVSGPRRDERGSFLELSWNGAEPVELDDGTTRTFLEDGDVVTISAVAPGASGALISLGAVEGAITPAPCGVA